MVRTAGTGGAAANAAENGEPVTQRLPMVAAVRRRRTVRMAPTVRSGGTDSSSEESSEDSEGADLDGGAAACAAAIEAVNCELRELQDRTVELVLERRRLEDMWDEIDAQNMEQQNAANEECQRQAAWQDAMNCAEMTWQDAVNEDVLQCSQFHFGRPEAALRADRLQPRNQPRIQSGVEKMLTFEVFEKM